MGNPKSDVRTHGSLLPSPGKDNRLPHIGNIYSSNARLNSVQADPNAISPSAAGFAMTAGTGHPMHSVQHQRYYGAEDLHNQWPNSGGFLPQNQYFANDLYLAGEQLSSRRFLLFTSFLMYVS